MKSVHFDRVDFNSSTALTWAVQFYVVEICQIRLQYVSAKPSKMSYLLRTLYPLYGLGIWSQKLANCAKHIYFCRTLSSKKIQSLKCIFVPFFALERCNWVGFSSVFGRKIQKFWFFDQNSNDSKRHPNTSNHSKNTFFEFQKTRRHDSIPWGCFSDAYWCLYGALKKGR